MIKLAVDTIDRNDINKLIEWLQQEPIPKLTKGDLTIEFEERWAKMLRCKYSVFVNSGSSANLLMIYSLIIEKRLKNNKIVVPALSWITTVAPVIQFGLQPILVDCNLKNLSVDLEKLEDIFKKENPAALVLVSVLGLVPDMDAVKNLCEQYGVLLLLDNCEGLGSAYIGHPLEEYALISTCSLYFGHHLSCIEGGVVSTNDEKLYNTLKMCRSHGWIRDVNNDRERENKKYKWQINDSDEQYTFYCPGFNLRNTEISAKLALLQLDKIYYIKIARGNNYLLYNKLIVNEYWKPDSTPFVSNLGYPIIHPKRNTIMKALRDNFVECRPLISGSMGRQPFWIERYGRQEMMNASLCHTAGMYVPNNAYISFKDVEFISNIVNSITCE